MLPQPPAPLPREQPGSLLPPALPHPFCSAGRSQRGRCKGSASCGYLLGRWERVSPHPSLLQERAKASCMPRSFFNPPLLIFKHPSLLLTLGSSPNTTPTMSMATDLNLLFPGHVGEAASGAHPSKGPRHSDTSASRKSGRQGPQTLGEVLLPVLYKFPNPIVFFPAQATFIC